MIPIPIIVSSAPTKRREKKIRAHEIDQPRLRIPDSRPRSKLTSHEDSSLDDCVMIVPDLLHPFDCFRIETNDGPYRSSPSIDVSCGLYRANIDTQSH
jgi:hypothetical protein